MRRLTGQDPPKMPKLYHKIDSTFKPSDNTSAKGDIEMLPQGPKFRGKLFCDQPCCSDLDDKQRTQTSMEWATAKSSVDIGRDVVTASGCRSDWLADMNKHQSDMYGRLKTMGSSYRLTEGDAGDGNSTGDHGLLTDTS